MIKLTRLEGGSRDRRTLEEKGPSLVVEASRFTDSSRAKLRFSIVCMHIQYVARLARRPCSRRHRGDASGFLLREMVGKWVKHVPREFRVF